MVSGSEANVLLHNRKIVVSKEQVSCKSGTEEAVLNLKNGLYYELNDVGSRIWNLLQSPKTISELRDILVAEYDVDRVQLEADIHDLLHQLEENQLVEIVG